MAKKKRPAVDFCELIVKISEKEIKAISSKFNVSSKVKSRIISKLRIDPQFAGNGLKVLNILYELFDSYGYTKEEFEQFMHVYPDLVNANNFELKRRLVILYGKGLIESAVFEHPTVLYPNTKLDYQYIYAICRNLELNDEEVSYDTVFAGKEYTYPKLEEMKKAFPLSDARYAGYEMKYNLEIVKRKKEQEIKLTYGEE